MAVPYGIICDHIKRGEVIFFLGAGASLSGRPAGATWHRNATFLPLGSELSSQLADASGFPSHDPIEVCDLSKVASYYAEKAADRPDLVRSIHDIFNRDYQLGAIHRFLAELDIPLLIVTTNYDDLIERAFAEKGKPYHLVTYPTESKESAASVLWWQPGADKPELHPPKTLPLSLDKISIIYKMHGTVDRRAKRKWDSFVITEEDYVDFLSRMTGQTAIPARFMLEFRMRRFLFLGYGLRDWNLRVMLKNLRTPLGGAAAISAGDDAGDASPERDLRAWAIQYEPTELEKNLWDARKVSIYDVEIDVFVDKLSAQLRT